jgi:glucokinase
VAESPGRILLGDIGGTNARFALFESGELTPIESVLVADYPRVSTVLARFLEMHRDNGRISGAMLAVAGPVEADRCVLTNSPWIIDAAELRSAFGFNNVQVINDFEAVAWALQNLEASDLFAIGGGEPVRGAPVAVLGPGTGLGLACLVAGPDGDIVIQTEGGHATLPGSSRREDAIIEHLRDQYGHVSAERVLSGNGIENLYDAIRVIDKIKSKDRTAAQITQAAASGTCQVSIAALDMFCAMLGTVAGNVALTIGARGGIYVAGGIVPRMIRYLAASEFRTRFESKGRFHKYLSAIPTNVIVHADPAFVGLRALTERLFRGKLT